MNIDGALSIAIMVIAIGVGITIFILFASTHDSYVSLKNYYSYASCELLQEMIEEKNKLNEGLIFKETKYINIFEDLMREKNCNG